KQLDFLPRNIQFANAKLPLDRFIEIGAAGISFHQPAIGHGCFHIVALELEQLCRSVSGAWSQGVLGVLLQKLSIGLDRAAHISLFLRLLRLVVKLLRISADFFLPGTDIFHFLSRSENDRRLSATGETEHSHYSNKQSRSHGTWQGICLRHPVKLAGTKMSLRMAGF